MEIIIQKCSLSVEVGDITEYKADVIVNAANSSLLGGGGVDGAIHRGAGPELLTACRKVGGCPTGESRITRGFNLPAQWIIHTVGPVYSNGRSGEAELLAASYRSSLQLADEYNLKSIFFPAISTGVYAYPMAEAAEVSLVTIRDYIQRGTGLTKIGIVLYNSGYYTIYEEVIKQLFGE